MKNYVSSVLFQHPTHNIWVIPIPRYLCESINMQKEQDYFFATLFKHDIDIEANKLELIISPFKQAQFRDLYNLRMKPNNEIGSTHEMLSLLKDTNTFGMNIKIINGIDCTCPDSAEVEVIGSIASDAKLIKYIDEPFELNTRIKDYVIDKYKEKADAKNKIENEKTIKSESDLSVKLLNKFSLIPVIVKEKMGKKIIYKDVNESDIEEIEMSSFYLLIEKCFDSNYIKENKVVDSVCKDTPVKIIESEEYFLLCFNDNLFNFLYSHFNVPREETSDYSFVTVRLDSERSSLAIILKNPNEKIYLFELTLLKDAQLQKITNILSNKIKIDFRSISSVVYPDESIKVDIAANVSNSKFDCVSKPLIKYYLNLCNKKEDLKIDIEKSEIKKVYKEVEFPKIEEEEKYFNIEHFSVGLIPQNTLYSIDVNSNFNLNLKEFNSLNDGDFVKELCNSCHYIAQRIHNKEAINSKILESKFNMKLIGSYINISNYDNINFFGYQNENNKWYIFIKKNYFLIVSYSGLCAKKPEKSKKRVDLLFSKLGTKLLQIEETNKELCKLAFENLILELFEEPIFKVPEKIGKDFRYTLYNIIDEGKNGVVWMGRDSNIPSEIVAIKKTKKPLALIEAIITNHQYFWSKKFLTKYYDFSIETNNTFITMEYIEGITLKKALKDESILFTCDYRRVISIMKNILIGVQGLHNYEKKILHLDLKPDNIMISNNGEIKILDYGFGAIFEDLHGYDLNIINRDPLYVAQEILKQEKNHIGPWTDIFSIGIIFYEMLTNKFPYRNYENQIVKNPNGFHILNGCSYCSPEFHKLMPLIGKAIMIEPSYRFQDINEMIKIFDDIIKN